MSEIKTTQVSLIHFTGMGTDDEEYFAARLLSFVKATRLKMDPEGFDKFKSIPVEDLEKELAYSSATIASSWEMVDVIFSINNISRACAQQITRTRAASYAMQSQRVTDMSEVTFHVPDSMQDSHVLKNYIGAFQDSLDAYEFLISEGVSLEDARGVLPMNSHCNLVAKYNLRAWVDLVRSRQSLRVQGEYNEVAKQMKDAVLSVWPWAAVFIEPKMSKAISIIEEIAKTLSHEQKIALSKAADLIKKESA